MVEVGHGVQHALKFRRDVLVDCFTTTAARASLRKETQRKREREREREREEKNVSEFEAVASTPNFPHKRPNLVLGKRANRNRSTFVETQTTTKGTDERRRKEEEEEEEEEESHAPSTYFSRYVIAPSIASKKVVVVFETPSHLLLLFCNNEDKREMGSNSLRLFLRAKLKGRIINYSSPEEEEDRRARFFFL